MLCNVMYVCSVMLCMYALQCYVCMLCNVMYVCYAMLSMYVCNVCIQIQIQIQI